MNVELCNLLKTGIALILIGGGMWLGQKIHGPIGAIVGAIVGFLISSQINLSC